MEEEDDPLPGGPVDQDLAGTLAVQVSDDVAMEERDRVMAEEMAAAVAPVSSATGMTKSSTEMNHAAGVSIAAVSVAGRQNSSSSSGDGIAIPPPPPPLPPGLVTPTYTEAMSERAGGGAAGASTPRYFFFGFYFWVMPSILGVRTPLCTGMRLLLATVSFFK